ncbi:PREDICTED: glutamine-rich protein 2 isoform X3 [Chinchilla lanigera]|uniref:glutamine-rich protein 2 isoform X3 n=1 Tax=Chinchilla lanigera TaxID=34839 RepID=UPI000697641D|nr:PREDICTED: glutamine-rich protein 2 isoform X3 [Chinchilla lanigera]
MPPATPVSRVSLRELADLAIGTPEVGAVNFTALHTLIVAILKNLNLQETLIDFQSLSPEGGRSIESLRSIEPLRTSRSTLSTPQLHPSKEKRKIGRSSSQILESQVKDLGDQVQDLTKQLQAVDSQVQVIVTHVQQITSQTMDFEAPTVLEVKDMPDTEEARIRSMKVQEDVRKPSDLLQDAVEDAKSLKEARPKAQALKPQSFQEVLRRMEGRMEELEKLVKERDDFLDYVSQKLNFLPGGEEVTMVTWEELEQAIADGWRATQAGSETTVGLSKRKAQSPLTASDIIPSGSSTKHASADHIPDSTGGPGQVLPGSSATGHLYERVPSRERSKGTFVPGKEQHTRARDEASMSRLHQPSTSQLRTDSDLHRSRERFTSMYPRRDIHTSPAQQDTPLARDQYQYVHPDQRGGVPTSQGQGFLSQDHHEIGLPGMDQLGFLHPSTIPPGVVPISVNQLGMLPPQVDGQGLVPLGMDQHGFVIYGMDQQGLAPPGRDQQGLVPSGTDQRGLPPVPIDGHHLVSPGLIQVSADQQGFVQPSLEASGFIQPGTERGGLIQPERDQTALEQPDTYQPGLAQPVADQRGLVQPGEYSPGLVQPGKDQDSLTQPRMGQRRLIKPGTVQQVLMQPGVDQLDVAQHGADQHRSVHPEKGQYDLLQPGAFPSGWVQPGAYPPGWTQPGADSRGLVQPGIGQRGLVQPRADRHGFVQPGMDQRDLVQASADQQGLVPPSADQQGLVPPSADQHGLVQPGAVQHGLVQPGMDQHGSVQPGAEQQGLMQPGADQHDLVPPGEVQHTLVQPGMDQQGLLQPGTVQHGLVQPGVGPLGLTPPGAFPRGLVQPGAFPRGLVQPGAFPRGLVQPGAFPGGLVQPGAFPRGMVQPGAFPRGMVQPGAGQFGMVPPGMDQHALVQPGADQRGLLQSGADQHGLAQPVTDQDGLVQPGTDQGALTQPGTDQGALTQPGTDQGTLTQPGTDQGAVTQPGTDQGAVTQPGTDRSGLVQPGVDWSGLAQSRAGQFGVVQPGIGQHVLLQPGADPRRLVQPGTYMPSLAQPGPYPPGLAQSGVHPPGLVPPRAQQPSLFQSGISPYGLVQPGAYPHGLVQSGMDQRGLRPSSADQQGLIAQGPGLHSFPTLQADSRSLRSPHPYQYGVLPPGQEQYGRVSPLLPGQGSSSPRTDTQSLVSPDTHWPGVTHPGIDQQSPAPLGTDMGSAHPDPDQQGQLYPGAVQSGQAYPVGDQQGPVYPDYGGPGYTGVDPHGQVALDPNRIPAFPAQTDLRQDATSFRSRDSLSFPQVSPEGSEPRSGAQSERHESVEKLAPNFPMALETFRLMGELIGLYVELKERMKELDDKAGQTDSEKIQYLFTLLVKKTLPPDLDEQMKSLKTLAKEVRQEKAKLDKLQRILEGDGEAPGKELKAGQLGLQLGLLRVTVTDIEKELAELRDSQEQGKAAMENSVVEASLFLQDQLDKLRTIIENMLASSSTLLSLSMTPHKSLAGMAPSEIHPEATCPACSLDLSHQVSTLVQRYEHLQEMVNNLAASRPSKKTKLQSQDEELLGRVQSAILQVQGDCEKLNITTSNLIEDHRQKQKDIDVLYQGLEKLEKEKANREHLQMEINVKADKSTLASKVSRVQFDATTEQLNHMMQELMAKMRGQEQDWQKLLDKLLAEMDMKLDRLELDPVKQELEDRWKSLREQLKERSPLYQADEAAAMRRQLLAHFHCLSCDRPLETPVTGQIIPVTPVGQALPGHRSIRPYTVFELGQVRQQSRNLKLGGTFPRGDQSSVERSVGRLRTMHSKMLLDIEKVQIHFGGSVKASSQMIRELLQAHCLSSPCYKRVPDSSDYTYSTMSRRCGGSHTLTYPYRRNRLQHLPQGLYAPEEIQIAMKHDEVDILGLDGHIYKGRMDTRLPGILTKDRTTKHKPKQSRPHGHRQQPLSNTSQLPSRPQSAQASAANSSVSSKQRKDRPVSSEGRLAQSDMTHPPSPDLQGGPTELGMNTAMPPEEGLEEPTRGPRPSTAQ